MPLFVLLRVNGPFAALVVAFNTLEYRIISRKHGEISLQQFSNDVSPNEDRSRKPPKTAEYSARVVSYGPQKATSLSMQRYP